MGKKLAAFMVSGALAVSSTVLFTAIAAYDTAAALVSVGSKVESVRSRNQYSASGNGTLTGLLEGYTAFNFFLLYESSLNYASIVHDINGAVYGAYQFTTVGEKQGFIDYCYAYNPVKYRELHNASIDGMDTEWLDAYNRDPAEFSRLQDEFAYQTMYQPMEDYLKNHGIDLTNRPLPVKAECFSINCRMGRETSRYSYILRSGASNSDSDEEFIRKIDTFFGNCYKDDGYDAACRDFYAPSIYYRWLVDNSRYYPGYPCEMNLALAVLKGEYDAPVSSGHSMPVDGTFGNGKFSGKTGIDYLDYAISIANDDSHGYDPHDRYYDHLQDYSCSQLVYYSLKANGYNVGSTQFWCNTMDPYMIQAGFQRLPFAGTELHTGDIVVIPDQHTQLYISDGYYAMSQADYDGQIGDLGNGPQAGYEVCVVPDGSAYTYIYRWPGK